MLTAELRINTLWMRYANVNISLQHRFDELMRVVYTYRYYSYPISHNHAVKRLTLLTTKETFNTESTGRPSNIRIKLIRTSSPGHFGVKD
jgi:hypothetical protein